MVSYVDNIKAMPECRNFKRNLSIAAYMSCVVAALPFQAHANYRTWPLDFGTNVQN